MFILKNINNECVTSGISITLGIYDEPFEKWEIITANQKFYFMDFNFSVYEVESLPSDYKDMKYCYTEEKGFYLNENYVEPVNTEEEIKRLTEENLLLKTKIDNMQEVLDYLVMK